MIFKIFLIVVLILDAVSSSYSLGRLHAGKPVKRDASGYALEILFSLLVALIAVVWWDA